MNMPQKYSNLSEGYENSVLTPLPIERIFKTHLMVNTIKVLYTNQQNGYELSKGIEQHRLI